MTRPTTCTVCFDGACPVCRSEIAHDRRQRGSESIGWVDASTCVAGRNWASCRLFRGRPGEALGACGAMGGKLVNAKGWCVAWLEKARPAWPRTVS